MNRSLTIFLLYRKHKELSVSADTDLALSNYRVLICYIIYRILRFCIILYAYWLSVLELLYRYIVQYIHQLDYEQ